MSGCPSREHLQQFLAEQLSDAVQQALETHVETCAACQATLARLSDEGDEVNTQLFRFVPPPAPLPADLDFVQQLQENPPPAEEKDFLPAEENRVSPITFPGAPTEKGPLGQLDGFAIRKELGAGRFGIVYQAYDELDRLVAIKVLRPELAASSRERSRFEHEARKAAAVKHDHIVTIHQVGHSAGFALPYLVMEYLDGEALSDRLQREGVMEPKEAARLVQQVALALAAAHARGLIHRDIKPSNILLEAGTVRAKLSDFGLARVTDGVEGSTSRSGRIVGTPAYMSPEQILSPCRIDGRSDVYSLGVVLYELLTRERPFRGATHLLLQQVIHDEPRPPRKFNDCIPRDLETICLKAMARAPGRRYATARELADDLGNFLAGEPIQARPVGNAEKLWRWCLHNRLVAALCTCVAGLLVGVAVVATLSAWRLGQEQSLTIQQRDRAERAEREKTEKLWQSYLDQVRARRSSREAGQRFASLDKLREAAAIVRSLNSGQELLSKNILELRNEAIACMALPDLRLLRTWPENMELISNPAFDAGLERYATSDNLGNIIVRRVADESEILRIPNTYARPDSVWCRFSPDDRFLAAKYQLGKSSRIVLWDLSSNKRIMEMAARCAAGGECLDFSPDSRRLAAAGPQETVELYDCLAGKNLKSLGRDLMPEHLAFDPSGRKLAACTFSTVQILDIDTTDILATLPQSTGKGGRPWSLAWSPDGKSLAVGSLDAKIRIWDISKHQQTMILEGHNETVIGLAFNHAGNLLLSCSNDGTGRLWDVIKARHLLTIPGRFRKLSSDGRQLALEQRKQLSIWEMADCRELTTFPCAATTLDFSPTKGLLATAGPDGVRLWDLHSAREAADLRLDQCGTATFHPKGRSLLTYGKASGLRLWPLHDVPEHAGGLQVGPPQVLGSTLTHSWRRACWSRDGRWLGVADYRNDTAFLLNTYRSGERLVLGSIPQLATIALSPDCHWAAVGACDHRKDLSESQIRIWHLPDGTPVRTLLGYSHAAFSPDGHWLVTGGDKDYRFWRISTWEPGLLLPRDQGLRDGFAPVAFSPDGRLLAMNRSPNHLQLVDPATGREVASLSAPRSSRITWVCFSPDGSQLGVANGQEVVHLWDLRAIRQQLAELGLDWSLPWYPPAKDLAKNNPARVRVLQESKESWRSYWLVRGRAHQAFGQSSEAVIDFTEALRVLQPDAPPLERSELLRLRALNYARNQAYEAALADLQKAVDLAPDSAPACHDLARLYVTGPQRLRDSHEALPLARRAVNLAPGDPRYQNTLGVVYYRLAKYARAMEALEQSLRESKGETAEFALFILAMCHARRGDAASAKNCYDRAVQWMQERQGNLLPYAKQPLDAFRAEAEKLLRSNETHKTSASVPLLARPAASPLFQHPEGVQAGAHSRKLTTLAGHTGRISSVALSFDGKRVLTGSADQTAVLWDTQTGSKLHTFTGHSDIVSSVALSSDGRRVLTGSFDFTAILWDATSGARLCTFTGHTREVVSVALSGDGQRVLTGSWDQTAILWDAKSGAKLQTFAGHSSCVSSVALSADEQQVLTGSHDHTAILWDAATGAKERTFVGHTSPVNSVALSADGQRILTGSEDHTAILWDVTSGAKLRIFAGHSQEVLSVALSGDGGRVLTASADQTAILWDAQSGAKLHTFLGHVDAVRSVAMSEDGRRALTGSLDRRAILWDATGSR